MALRAEELMESTGPDGPAVASQPQQEGAAGNSCSICLNEMNNPAYINTCFHTFCLICIQKWMNLKSVCPLCRQPFKCVLHTVRADDDYQEYRVGTSNCQERPVTRQRARNRAPQHQYYLRSRTTNNEPTVRRGVRRQQETQQGRR